jgi:hypothetical protein
LLSLSFLKALGPVRHRPQGRLTGSAALPKVYFPLPETFTFTLT